MSLQGATPFASGFYPLQQTLQVLYPCLGILCSDVGSIAGNPTCTDPANNLLALFPIAYDTTMYEWLDLDLSQIINSTLIADFASALSVYTQGRGFNFISGSGQTITWQYFATLPTPTYDLAGSISASYWYSYTVTSRADDFISAALNPSGIYMDAAVFASQTNEARSAAVAFGILTLVDLPQIKRFLDLSVIECRAGGLIAQSGNDWDNSFAIYAGGSVGLVFLFSRITFLTFYPPRIWLITLPGGHGLQKDRTEI